MKTVTQNFIDAWGKKYGKNGRVFVQYQLRYWNGAAYVYTGTWVNLTLRDFTVSGQIIMKLDVPLLNTVKSSNISIKVKNTDYQWLEQNVATGIFKPDAISAIGYDPFLTKFRVQFGYQLSDGTFEMLNMFTGLAIDYIFDTQSAEAEIIVSGNEFLLQAADAQLVSDVFTSEACSPASGDGVNKVFNTTSLGVSFIGSVTNNAIVQTQGTNYTLSNIGVYNSPATITFITAPIAGHLIKSSGRKWKTLQKIEDLVGFLCDQANIGAGQRTISPALFPGVSARITINTSAQWQSYIQNNTDPYVVLDSIAIGYQIDNEGFETGDFTSWTYTNSNGGSGSTSASVSAISPHTGAFSAQFSTSVITPNILVAESYVCLVDGVGNEYFKQTFSAAANTWTQINYPVSLTGTYYLRFNIANNLGGFARLRSNQTVSAGSGGTTITFWVFGVSGIFVNPTMAYRLDDIRAHGITATGDVTTLEFDLGAAPTSWGAIISSVSLGGGTMTIQTQTSTTSGGSYSALQNLDGSNVPQSPLRQFLKVKVLFTSNGPVTDGPVLASLIIPFVTSVVELALADFSGRTCFSAIQALAQLCDYEWGFDGDGKLFFRSKTSGTSPVVTIDQSKAIARITDFRPGYDAVINDGQVKYGDYYSEYNSSSLPESSPTSQQRFFTQIKSEDYSGFLLAFDPNIAAGRAQLLHDNNYKPRRRARLQGKIIPQVDLSDVINVSYFDRPIQKDNIFGDPLQTWSDIFGTPTNLLLRATNFKVVGMMVDPIACTGEYDIQEVLP